MNIINKEIDMLAQFNKNGSIRPIRFRIEENDEQQVIKIKTIKHVDEQGNFKQKIRKFSCDVEVNGVTKNCEIIFDLLSLEWKLYKI